MNNKSLSTGPVSSGLISILVIQEKNKKGKLKPHLTSKSRRRGISRFSFSVLA